MSTDLSRRSFMRGLASCALAPAGSLTGLPIGAYAAAALSMPALVALLTEDAKADTKSIPLRLHSTNTGDKLSIDLFVGSNWNPTGLVQADYMLRDFRQNLVVQNDRRLYAALYVLQRAFVGDGFVKVNSGFRTTTTNEMLRRQGYGAARESFHTKARAVDYLIPNPNATLPEIARVAKGLHIGAVALYNNFIHMDTGDPDRSWGLRY